MEEQVTALGPRQETHRKSPEQIRGSRFGSLFCYVLFRFLQLVAVVLGPAREVFGQLSDTGLNLF